VKKELYDLNVWNEGWHNLDRGVEATEENSRWKISVHHLDDNGDGTFSTGEWIESIEFYIEPEEAKQMTLGVAESDGGLYGSDEDFFIDPDGFLEVYGDAVPERVREFVERFTQNG